MGSAGRAVGAVRRDRESAPRSAWRASGRRPDLVERDSTPRRRIVCGRRISPTSRRWRAGRSSPSWRICSAAGSWVGRCRTRRNDLVISALQMGVGQRKPEVGSIHHSDKGSHRGAVRPAVRPGWDRAVDREQGRLRRRRLLPEVPRDIEEGPDLAPNVDERGAGVQGDLQYIEGWLQPAPPARLPLTRRRRARSSRCGRRALPRRGGGRRRSPAACNC